MLKSAPAYLKKSSDVTVVQVGFSTNLNALLDSEPGDLSPLDGAALVKEKVSLLSAMAGNFVESKPE